MGKAERNTAGREIRIGRARWRPALRMAWRNAMRAPGRTVLVAVLVGLPVLAAVSIDLFTRTSNPTVEDRVRWGFGNADVQVIVSDQKRMAPDRVDLVNGSLQNYDKDGKPLPMQRDPESVDPLTVLPTGARVLPVGGSNSYYEGFLKVRDKSVSGGVQLMHGDDPMTAGMYLLRSGRYPKSESEVAVASAMAERIGVDKPGAKASLRIDDTTEVTITGIVDDPQKLGGTAIWVSRAFPMPPGAGSIDGQGTMYLADLPDISLASLKKLMAAGLESGIAIFPREAMLYPDDWRRAEPTAGHNMVDALLDPSWLQGVALGALILGFGLLEIVLLAGAAFAVGIRRQTHELGLLAVVGGSGKDVRRAVLAHGIVLGLIAAVGGVTLGVSVPVLLRPWVERLIGHEFSSWGFAPLDYLGFGLVGLLSGLAAALIPAVGASRITPVAALNGRFRTTSGSARPPKLGIALLAGGLASGIAGSLLLTQQFDEFRRVAEAEKRGVYQSVGGVSLAVALGLLGLTLLAIGLVRMMPAIVSWIGAVSGRLPLSLRLSFRDASRHRHRTAPAAAAIMIAVAGSMRTACMVAGVGEQGRMTYLGSLPFGDASLSPTEQLESDIVVPSKLKELLPGSAFHPIHEAILPKAQWPKGSEQWFNLLGAHARPRPGEEGDIAPVGVIDPAMLRALPGKETDQAVAVLEAGKAVVLQDESLFGGRAKLELVGGLESKKHKLIWLPAFRFHTEGQWRCGAIPCLVVSKSTVEKLGFELGIAQQVYIHPPKPLDQATQDKTRAAGGESVNLEIENGYQDGTPLILLIVTGVAAFVTLVGVAISVALSNAESRPDLATLAAVGAPPRRRRMLAASQATLVGGLGCLTGIGLGIVLGFVGRGILGTAVFNVPWSTLLLTGVGVPLFAALCAALLTRSRLPMVRRVE